MPKKSKKISDTDDEFEKKYKGVVLTKDMIKSDKIFLDYEIPFGHQYECPRCKNAIEYYDGHSCDTCNNHVCPNCLISVSDFCKNDNCYYCRNGYCYNNKFYYYCKDCYVDPLDKYKGKIITHKMLEKDDDLVQPYNESACQHKYKCPVCETVGAFDEVKKCQDCKKYVCNNCCKDNYVNCEYDDCKYCKQYICYNSSVELFCTNCYPYDDSSSDDEKSENLNNSDDSNNKHLCQNCGKDAVVKVVENYENFKCRFCKKSLYKQAQIEYYCSAKKCFNVKTRFDEKLGENSYCFTDDKLECDHCGRRHIVTINYSVIKIENSQE